MADDPGTGTEVQDKPELAERVGNLETEQQRQGGVLDQILERLTKDPKASGTSGAGSPGSSTEPHSAGPSVEELVRQGVEKIEAEKARKAEQEEAANSAEGRLKAIEDRLPERKPADPVTGGKAKLQARLFGKPDQR